jgi:hypothetical protein
MASSYIPTTGALYEGLRLGELRIDTPEDPAKRAEFIQKMKAAIEAENRKVKKLIHTDPSVTTHTSTISADDVVKATWSDAKSPRVSKEYSVVSFDEATALSMPNSNITSASATPDLSTLNEITRKDIIMLARSIAAAEVGRLEKQMADVLKVVEAQNDKLNALQERLDMQDPDWGKF